MADEMTTLGRMAAPSGATTRARPPLTLENSAVLLGDLLVGAEALWGRQEALDRATTATNAALAWLRNARSTDIDAVWSEETAEGGLNDREEHVALVEKLTDAFDHWYEQQTQRGARGLPMPFWLLWVELGCSLAALTALDASTFPPAIQHRGVQAIEALTRAADAGNGALLPADFPSSSSHCDQQGQVQFCVGLWDAAVLRPLQGWSNPTAHTVDDMAVRLLSLFIAWVSRAMSGFEIAFLANVEQEISARARDFGQTSAVSPQVIGKFLAMHTGQPNKSNAGAVAVSALVATALSSHSRESTELAESRLERLRGELVQKMALSSLPHAHDPLAIAATGLGMAAWSGDAPTSVSTSRVVMQVVAVVRVALLPLLSSRVATDEHRLGEATERLVTKLRARTADQSQHRGDTIDLVYRVLESGVAETIAFFHSSSAQHAVLGSALQSVMPSELFRPTLAAYVESNKSAAPEQLEFPSDNVLALLKHLYDVVAPISLELSVHEDRSATYPFASLVRSFSLLARLELAREAWTSPARNQAMATVTQRVEEAIDQAPDAVFTTLFQSLNASLAGNSDLWSDSSEEKAVPGDVDVVRGCQVLAVSLLIQRKLRTLLLQSSNRQLLDDAVAVVFLGVNSAFEPLDTFAHQFLGVCLTHLAQFVSLYSIAPYYVQLTLPAFPSSVTQQTIAAVCGSVFGALFYSHASGGSNAEVARRMTLWTMKQFINRSKELLLAEADDTEDAAASAGANSDGLYLVGLMAEIAKMSPLGVVGKAAMELEALVRDCDAFDHREHRQVCSQVKHTILASISQNCEAEKRAWLAAWFIELERQYPSVDRSDKPSAAVSRL